MTRKDPLNQHLLSCSYFPKFKITFQQLFLAHWFFHLWILLALLAIDGSESGEGSYSSSLMSTDEVLGFPEARGPLSCSFPSHWSGNWFQSGVRAQITITSSLINLKGKCLEVDGEKYLVYQPHSNCYKCLVFTEQHINVLQYKESYCHQERRSLHSMCSTISGDARLYAMFRLNAEPIDCPLQGPFSFSYNRGNGECRDPESNLDSCTQPSRLLFNYQACPDVPKTESVEEELQCLAAWKEGSNRYFLGLIQHRDHTSYEDRFRCFAYEIVKREQSHAHNLHHHGQHYPQTLALGRSRPKPYQGVTMTNNFNGNSNNNNSVATGGGEVMYRVEQSDDATCDGLSTMEGSRRMFLRKVAEPNTENCQFPSWLQTHPQWFTLDQSSIYEFDGDQLRVNNYSEQLISANGPDSLAMSASCMKIVDDEPGYRAQIVLHARSSCKIGYQCMVLFKRDADILEVQFGEWSRKHEEACHFYFDPATRPYITLISSTPKSAQCPALGEFSLQLSQFQYHHNVQMDANMNSFGIGSNAQGLCETNGTLRMGCTSLDFLQLEISSKCHDHNDPEGNLDDKPTSREVTGYNCHGWWEEDGTTYMVATLSSSRKNLRPQRHCFVLRDSSREYPEWIRLQQSENSHMSLRGHSNRAVVAGQQQDLVEAGGSFGRSSQMLEEAPSNQASTSAALFFFNNNNNNNHAAAGKILEISTFADSCRRNVRVGRDGERAFNATKLGHCFASSSSPSVIIRGGGSVQGWESMAMIMVMSEMMTSVTWILPLCVMLLLR